jgi:hypothetical protein
MSTRHVGRVQPQGHRGVPRLAARTIRAVGVWSDPRGAWRPKLGQDAFMMGIMPIIMEQYPTGTLKHIKSAWLSTGPHSRPPDKRARRLTNRPCGRRPQGAAERPSELCRHGHHIEGGNPASGRGADFLAVTSGRTGWKTNIAAT